jgi:hypothetical protein
LSTPFSGTFLHGEGQERAVMVKNQRHEPASQPSERNLLRPRQSQRQAEIEEPEIRRLFGRKASTRRLRKDLPCISVCAARAEIRSLTGQSPWPAQRRRIPPPDAKRTRDGFRQ